MVAIKDPLTQWPN